MSDTEEHVVIGSEWLIDRHGWVMGQVVLQHGQFAFIDPRLDALTQYLMLSLPDYMGYRVVTQRRYDQLFISPHPEELPRLLSATGHSYQPMHCQKCRHIVDQTPIGWRCPNSYCPGRLASRLYYFLTQGPLKTQQMTLQQCYEFVAKATWFSTVDQILSTQFEVLSQHLLPPTVFTHIKRWRATFLGANAMMISDAHYGINQHMVLRFQLPGVIAALGIDCFDIVRCAHIVEHCFATASPIIETFEQILTDLSLAQMFKITTAQFEQISQDLSLYIDELTQLKPIIDDHYDSWSLKDHQRRVYDIYHAEG